MDDVRAEALAGPDGVRVLPDMGSDPHDVERSGEPVPINGKRDVAVGRTWLCVRRHID
ncbi:hypothetical protein GCM10027068_44870 [Prescottella soli]